MVVALFQKNKQLDLLYQIDIILSIEANLILEYIKHKQNSSYETADYVGSDDDDHYTKTC
jgi:hypothetical protein